MTIGPWMPLALFAVLATAGAWSDARRRTIPNGLSLAMAALGVGAVWITAGGNAALLAAGHFALALLVGMGLYALRMWGGGDAKFYAATAAWFPLRHAPALLMAVALCGLAVVLVWLVRRRMTGGPGSGLNAQLPYGLAIAAGGVMTMTLKTFPAS